MLLQRNIVLTWSKRLYIKISVVPILYTESCQFNFERK